MIPTSLKRTWFVVALVASVVATAHADEIAGDLAKLGFAQWHPPSDFDGRYSPPIRTPQAVYVADYYLVENKSALAVRKATNEDINPENVIFDAGTFDYIGIDGGEFGGGLYVGEVRDETLLLRRNILALMPEGNDLYIFSGLCHMGPTGGAVHVIRNYRRPSSPTRVTLLPDAPMAVSRVSHWSGQPSFAMAGCKSLTVFVPDTRLEIELHPVLWGYPTSVIEYKDHYVIGISDGVAVLSQRYSRSPLRYFVPR